MNIQTVVLEEPGDFYETETELDTTLAPDEALLKVHRIGICGTDLHAYAGEQPFFSYPRILGHELGVEVVETGSRVDNISVGDRCSVEPYRYNPEDQAVKSGKPNCAEHMSVLGVHEDGGMREYFKFPAKFLHVSEKMSYDQLALVEPLGIGCHAVNRADITSDDRVLVIGAGPIGLGALQFALATGAEVAIMEIDKGRMEFCQESFDLAGGINPLDEDAKDQLKSLFGGDLPSVVLDATGNKQSMENAFDLVAHGGKLVYIGLIQGDLTFHDPDFHKKELTLMASRNALAEDFKQIIRLVEEGKIDTDPWITHRAQFDDMIDEFDGWLKPEAGVIKAMVEVT
ncbi:zinc-binding alcohol dehydrogenase family protein [Aliifodinibius sp. S!AR15-10]|uniref:zinc-binding alcohol dehydrogenase family protein n=1 Tax=Aliifodinibius sp. S!AR15-10 TaxID=2950437 RepID=UPI0028617064|nr:zinc-binding alcohol dehydrogenase family protein [Aliifodinibius sp. S!AR15-10]MDR8393805.1 zinc-binding alcohol dehydrogenase family protein [Aliifodinibius sp. S!AR15-10]